MKSNFAFETKQSLVQRFSLYWAYSRLLCSINSSITEFSILILVSLDSRASKIHFPKLDGKSMKFPLRSIIHIIILLHPCVTRQSSFKDSFSKTRLQIDEISITIDNTYNMRYWQMKWNIEILTMKIQKSLNLWTNFTTIFPCGFCADVANFDSNLFTNFRWAVITTRH